MNSFKKTLYAVISGIILSLGWYPWGTGLFLLIGFVPLLLVEENICGEAGRRKGQKVFLYASVAFITWNAAATWWIFNASFVGMVAAFVVTTLFMTIPFWLYSFTKRNMGRRAGYISLVLFWLAYEFAYTHGEISWPWLTLGNGFLYDHRLIQWYEITGVMGGSLWILVTNLLIFEIIRLYLNRSKKRVIRSLLIITLLVIIIPITASLIRYYTYHEIKDPREIVVVQPNIDPYMKFNDIPPLEQTAIQVRLAAKYVTPSTDYVVCPETSVMDNIWIDQIKQVPDIRMIKNFVEQHGKLKYITGILCYKHYTAANKTPTARELGGQPNEWFDEFNSAIQIDTTPKIPIYNKSKLVVGVEKMPYPGLLKILKPLTLHLGGTFRSEGTQKEREVFRSADDSVAVAPVICYESVYGEFVTGYIKKGANIIFVITNDGWWGDTPGHRQHNALSTIRAIETRRSVARSANTGTSSFIDQRGDILEKLTWWKRGALRHDLNLNNHITFYVKHGDFIASTAFYLSFLMLLAAVYTAWKNKTRSNPKSK